MRDDNRIKPGDETWGQPDDVITDMYRLRIFDPGWEFSGPEFEEISMQIYPSMQEFHRNAARTDEGAGGYVCFITGAGPEGGRVWDLYARFASDERAADVLATVNRLMYDGQKQTDLARLGPLRPYCLTFDSDKVGRLTGDVVHELIILNGGVSGFTQDVLWIWTDNDDRAAKITAAFEKETGAKGTWKRGFRH
jgi:hypothetical protein